jgi:DNA-binding transcriptional ArsR family regulator
VAEAERVEIIQDAARAAVALHPVRLQILERLEQPASPSTLSKTLGIPRQHLNYHMRELEEAGLVELLEEKKKGSVTERIYRSTARTYVIGPKALGELRADPDTMQDRFSSEYLIALGSRLIEDVAELRAERQPLPALALETSVNFASDSDRSAFMRELTAARSRLIAAYHHDDGEEFRMIVAAHPAV